MSKKFLKLVERDSVNELTAYFAALPKGKPLDKHDELVLLEYYPVAGISSYINRFKFSEEAELRFVDKATGQHLRAYINYYGLRPETQKYVIDKGLTAVALDFIRMRRFYDVDYLLKHGSAEIIRAYIIANPFDADDPEKNDERVIMLLHHENSYLFKTYVDNGRYVSENVQKLVIEEKNKPAFTALMFYFNRRFKKKARTMTLAQMKEKEIADVMLSDELQLMVLDCDDRMFLELMLRTTPLSVEAQKLMFERNFDAEWFKFHVEHLYGVGCYRFAPEFEQKLFKLLASKNLDDCLTTFRQRDDVSFVQCASSKAVTKYIKDFWLSDDGQVALIARGDADLIGKLISRYSPEHGLCWQAEVKLVEIASVDTIKQYISFHSMCGEGLAKLRQKSQEAIDFYYSRHAY